YTTSKQYEELVELVLTAMPELTVVTWTDEDGSEHFDHVEFDTEADNSGVITALQEVFDTVNLEDFLGEDIDSFTVNPVCEYSFIRDLGRQISNNEIYEDGSFEVLCYYINNKDTLDIGEKNELLYRCIQAILWTTYGIQNWNFEYLDRYQGITDEIIEAAASDDEEALYQGLVTLYEKKLSESEETAKEWAQYEKPYNENGAVIDKIYCLELIKSKLEPLSEIVQEVPTDSRLYNYLDNKENVSADLLDAAIYDLVDVVGRSHPKALYDLMYVLQGVSWSCLEDPNPDNLSEVKNALISLQQRLILGQDMDPAYDGVEIREEYLYDYAEYLDFLIGNGAEKSLPLRQFYESRDTGTQTPELALSAANVVMRLVDRVNTETQTLQDFVNPVFQSLEGSQQDFCTALNAIIIEQGEYPECTIEQAQYYQNRLKTRIQEDDFTRSYYEGEKALNFFGAISCFININLFYGEEQAVYNDFKQKEQLLNNFIEAMPDLNVVTWTDPVDQSIRFDHVEYDTQADMSGVVSAIQAVFDGVELSDYFGDLLTEFTVDPLYADSYIHELARQICYFEQNEEGFYDALYNYTTNYSTMDPQQKMQIVADCIGTILWSTYDKQSWSSSYMDRYQATVDNIITAAEGDDVEALYQGLVTLYEKKLSESEQTAAEWADYEKPFSETGEAIDKAYCLGLVKGKLLPLSEIIDSVPTNSSLYNYYNSEKPIAELLDMAIYDLVDTVRNSYVASYPIQKGLLGNLFTALEAKDAAMTYQALNNIYDYSIATGSTDSIIFGAEYSVVYMKELGYWLLPENGTNDLQQFYQIYPTLTGEERTKEIAEFTERAFWNVHNILTVDGSSWMIDKYSNTDAYQVLVDAIIDAMPTLNVITFQDPVDSSIHFDHVEYDVTANQTEVVNAVQALIDGVNLEQFEMTGLTVDPSYAQQIISELATRISYFEPYIDGSFDSLYVYNSKRPAIDTAEKMYLIQDCVNTILWSVYHIQNN
ncbi:MAG: hypothetical protein K0R46_3244, partial [Herbinix sp.]|nr:hypothetical protein [Herbinix sp.]